MKITITVSEPLESLIQEKMQQIRRAANVLRFDNTEVEIIAMAGKELKINNP